MDIQVIKVLIVDDELAMLAVMKRKLARIDDVVVTGSYRNAAQALDAVKREPVDLVFVDIKIANDSGLELARRIREIDGSVYLVFITSHKEFAIDSFDAYPLDYMVKPVVQSRLEQTISRAIAGKAKTKAYGEREADSGELRVRGLGGLEASGRLGPVKWVSRKSAELFACLLLHRGKEVTRDSIIEDVFPDMPLNQANLYLNTVVYQLRQALKFQTDQEIVRSTREEYSLDMTAIDADFIAFESYASTAAEWDEFGIREAISWEARYTGELFEGKSYIWVASERTRLEELYATFAKRIIRWLLRYGQAQKASPIARKIALRHELDEEANSLLLQVYHGMNDMSAFRRHYAQFSELYWRELGIPVSGQFAELYRRLQLDRCTQP